MNAQTTEQDMTPKSNLIIWGCFLLFALVLYFTITALTIYFRAEAERELDVKVGSVTSKELMELRRQEEKDLKGIKEAMEKVVRASN